MAVVSMAIFAISGLGGLIFVGDRPAAAAAKASSTEGVAGVVGGDPGGKEERDAGVVGSRIELGGPSTK